MPKLTDRQVLPFSTPLNPSALLELIQPQGGRTANARYFAISAPFQITEHDSLAAEPRADGEKWAWLARAHGERSGPDREREIYRMSGRA